MKNSNLTKSLFFASVLMLIQTSYAQLADGFDIRKAYLDAKAKHISETDIDGYVKTLHYDYLSHKNTHNHSSEVLDLGTIYLGNNHPNAHKISGSSPNSAQNTYCPNAGFEQLDFSSWIGGYGQVSTGSTGAPFPNYTQTAPIIVSPAGNNASIVNTQNYHTVMTTPAANNVYPNCVGYDSIACRVIGTQTISEIPVVNPLGGPASVRLNGALSNYRASKLNYNMTLNPNNKNFSVSYALVLNSGGHTPAEQPYFSVKVTDQNGNLVPGCSQYTITIDANVTNPSSPLYDPTWKASFLDPFSTFYRPWSTYAFDFSNYPNITSVNVEFYVGGCSQGGHYGYAYVDAECSQGGAVASFCAGSNTSALTAPAGYTSYQWIGPGGPVSAANGGNTNTATVTPVSAGQVFTCNVTSVNGCASAFQTTIAITTVSVTGVSSTPSCPNGTSGTANVTATGSSLGYNYQWFDNTGTPLGSTQSISGLAPGTYSVIVSTPLCGSSSSTVSVGLSPPLYYQLSAPYCGSFAWITKTGGSNYKWYTANPLALIPGITTASLAISSPINGSSYFLSYTTASGCKDSIKYTLAQSAGGNVNVSNIKSTCPGNSDAYAVIELQTNAPPAYSYSVSGPAGYSSVLANTTSLKDSLINLSVGTYSAVVFDGQCLYNTTFTVNPYIYSFTLTPTSPTICAQESTTLTVNYGNTNPSSCGLSSSGGCTTPASTQIGFGTSVNSSTSYPAIYGNWYENTRHQILYRASELLAAGIQPGKISSIAFNVTNFNNGTTTYPGFTIKMKCTSVASLSSSIFDNTGLTQVYYAASVNVTTGWNTYQFPVPYEWDGVSNIIVDVCTDFTSNFTYNASSPYSTTPFVSVLYYRADSPNVACMTTSAATSSSLRPNIKFGNCSGSNPSAFTYSWTPSTGLSSTTAYTTIATPLVNTIYTVVVSPIGQSNCMQAQSSTVTVIPALQPTITPVGPYCSNFAVQTMTASPMGGIWSSTTTATSITSGGQFSPSASVIGNNKLVYTLGGGNCIGKDSILVDVVQFIPATITGTAGPYCIYDTGVDLQSIAQYTGGVWSGAGVIGTNFTPVTAGSGIHVLTYSADPSPSGLCPDQKTISVLVNAKPNVNALTDNTKGCSPLDINFYTTSVANGSAAWNYGDGSSGSGLSSNHTYTVPGVYIATITYTDAIGCVDTTNILTAVTVYSVPVSSFYPSLVETTVIDGQIEFTNTSTVLGTNTYTWNVGGLSTSTQINESYLFVNAGTYVITLTTENPEGCLDDTSVVVKINPDVVLYVPNAFTPGNNDGMNDEFQIFLPPSGVDYSTFNLTIYDRWGEVVYKTNDINKFWNGSKNNSGSLLKQDTYVWKIAFRDELNGYHEKTGHVTLLRK